MKASKMKILRITIGKSQKILEQETGIGQWKISQIERGLPPNPDEAAKIAKALGVNKSNLFSRENTGINISSMKS